MSDPLSVAGSAVGIISLGIQVTQGLYKYYIAVRNQNSDIAHTTQKLGRLLELLGSLRGQLDSRKFRPDDSVIIAAIEFRIAECEECVEELQSESAKFQEPKPDSIWAATKATARRAAYPFRQSTLQRLDEDVDEIINHLSLALQMLQQKDIGEVRDDVEETNALLGLIRADQVHSTIHGWLKAPDASVNFNLACKKKQQGTGMWLVKDTSFESWLKKPDSFLWLKGFAGSGKSVLCSTAIQYAFRHRRSNPRVGIAFFFFSFNDTSKQDVSALIRALVLQLSGQLGDGHAVLSRFYEKYRNFAPTDQALSDCLHELVRSFEDVYVIIDALDESPRDKHREDVLDMLVDLRAWKEAGMHLLVTSRDEVDVRDALRALPEECIVMKNEGIDKDIALYVHQHLRNDRRLQKWVDYHERIETALTKRAKGVFRWVECQFQEIAACPQSEDLLDQLLESLPRSLDETYERMLVNIPPASHSYARQMLLVLCRTKRPLRVSELVDAVAVELAPVPRLNVKRRLRSIEAVQQVCPGMTETYVDREYIPYSAYDSDECGFDEGSGQYVLIRLAHFSVQEYLLSERILHDNSNAISQFYTGGSDSHAVMASICLTYLLEQQLIVSSNRGMEYPFAAYAAYGWPDHFRECNEDTQVERQALQLLQGLPGAFEAWNSILVWDFFSLVARLYPNSEAKDANVGNVGNALTEAVFGNYGHIVRYLVEHGADVNSKGIWFGGETCTPLRAAVHRGYEEIFQYLIDHGADVNEPQLDHQHFYPLLSIAASKGPVSMVLRLLENNDGARAHYEGDSSISAIEAAVEWGRRDVLELLLAHMAEAAMPKSPLERALRIAARRGYYEIAEALLCHGTDPDAFDDIDKVTPLATAAIWGNHRVMRLLLLHGADVDGGRGYGTALHQSIRHGGVETARLLLDHGADPQVRILQPDDAFFIQGETAEDVAMRLRNLEMRELLLPREKILESTSISPLDPMQ